MSDFVVRPQAPEEYSREFPEYPLSIIQLLYNRHLLTQNQVDAFLDPQYHELHDPFLFRDMRVACDRIFKAIADGELIAIHGDYDADGVSGSVILHKTLSALGARTMVFLPHRDKDGYGVNSRTVEYFRGEGVKLMITCDCGISNACEISEAKKHGIDTIVTDHHQVPEELPQAYAIIHPKVPGEGYPEKLLAGGGVAFKLAQGLLKSPECHLPHTEREAFEKWLLDLASISTVADMVDLSGENRILVRYGLLVLSKNRRLGLRYLLEEAGVNPLTITTHTIGFQIAPRINAAGRMDHANTAYMLLKSDDPLEAKRFAQLLEQQNKDRQKVTEGMYREALGSASEQKGSVYVFFKREWSAGLTGLVAGKLSKEFRKPVFVMGFDGERIVGSGRSPDGVKIMDGVYAVKEHLLSYGGHPQACGFRFDEKHFDEVVQGLREYFNATLPEVLPAMTIDIEAELRFPSVNWELTDYLKKFQPFGQGNPEPMFLSRAVTVSDIKKVGQKMNHVKMVLQQDGVTRQAIAFDQDAHGITRGSLIDIAYTVLVNQWNGNQELQLRVSSMKQTV